MLRQRGNRKRKVAVYNLRSNYFSRHSQPITKAWKGLKKQFRTPRARCSTGRSITTSSSGRRWPSCSIWSIRIEAGSTHHGPARPAPARPGGGGGAWQSVACLLVQWESHRSGCKTLCTSAPRVCLFWRQKGLLPGQQSWKASIRD